MARLQDANLTSPTMATPPRRDKPRASGHRRNRGHIKKLRTDFPLALATLPEEPEIFDDERVTVVCEYADSWLEVLQISGFEQLPLDESIFRNLQQLCIVRPTVTQKWMLQHIYASTKDVIVHATARTGKTFGYTLPIALKIAQSKKEAPNGVSAVKNAPIAIALSPTKTFGYQLFYEIDRVLHGSTVKVAHGLGGVEQRTTERDLGSVDLLVGTAGRVKHLLNEGIISLHNLRYIVYDEADELFHVYGDPEEDDAHCIVGELRKHLTRFPDQKIRSIFCSATFRPGQRFNDRLFLQQPSSFVQMTIGVPNLWPSFVKHHFVFIERDAHKAAVFKGMLRSFRTLGQTVVFALHEHVPLVTYMVYATAPAGKVLAYEMHSDNDAEQNLRVLNRTRDHVTNVMVTTRIGARGLNFPMCTCVVNFDMPKDKHEFLNRLSRCALTGRQATAFTIFCAETDGDTAPWLCDLLVEMKLPVPLQMRRAINAGARPDVQPIDWAATRPLPRG